MLGLGKYFLVGCIILWSAGANAVVLPKRDQVLKKAADLLENWSISYVYGGSVLGEARHCEACNLCLASKKSEPKQRLTDCPVCNRCSLDCSHYTFEVFKQAGLQAAYLTTALMNSLSPGQLATRYKLLDIGSSLSRAMPGDLLVYDGHVVLLEKKFKNGTGDLIHVTSGRELRGPGNGIQRERHAKLAYFRGPLLRILRHVDLAKEMRDLYVLRRGSLGSPGKPDQAHE